MSKKALDSSIPANNEKIIEIYNKVKSGQLNPSPDFQRKLVWKRQHKINFINTILLNYPFPEIYKAPGELDVETLNLSDLIVDGQQRITTIVNFIDGKDVFALPRTPIKFSDLTKEAKKKFLNYEVSIRYLKNAAKAQVKEIFQRINNTEYSLNKMERLNAQWGDSEFVCYGKQIIEEDLAIDNSLLTFVMKKEARKAFLEFFHKKNVFTESDNSRMLSLQYILTMVATIVKESYFRRNDEVQSYIELYNDEFENASEVTEQLLSVIRFIDRLGFENDSFWYNKANVFTLIVELYKYEISSIDPDIFKGKLVKFEERYKAYSTKEGQNKDDEFDLDSVRYFGFAREAVNEKSAREHRGKMLTKFIVESFVSP
ncbi:MAG: DUF262 domain-containing protein [Methanosarcinaceae archaeon]